MNITPLTNQELFDRVATHLLTQGERARGVDSCLYRTHYGLSCAVGGVIPDDLYHPGIERTPAKVLASGNYSDKMAHRNIPQETKDGLATLLGKANPDLIDCLQAAHDTSDPENWWTELEKIANRFNLDPSVLE